MREVAIPLVFSSHDLPSILLRSLCDIVAFSRGARSHERRDVPQHLSVINGGAAVIPASAEIQPPRSVDGRRQTFLTFSFPHCTPVSQCYFMLLFRPF